MLFIDWLIDSFISCSSDLRYVIYFFILSDTSLAKLWMNYELLSKIGLPFVQCYQSLYQGCLGAYVIYSATD